MEPQDIAALAERISKAERFNWGASSSREERNKNWAFIIGCVHHGHALYNLQPDARWHIKDADGPQGGRPQSDDVAVRMPDRHFWDFIGNAGADNYSYGASADHGPLPDDQYVYAPPFPAGGGTITPPVPPPTTEHWTPHWTLAHEAILDRLRAQGLGQGDQEMLRVARQLNHSFPGEHWNRKRSRPGAGLSPDTIAKQIDGGTLYGVRVGTNPTLVWGPLPGQVFDEQAAGQYNYLPDTPAPPVTPPVTPVPPVTPPVTPVDPPPPSSGVTLDDLAAELIVLSARVLKLTTEVAGLKTDLASARTEIKTLLGKEFAGTLTAGWPIGQAAFTIKAKS